jgi:hypothetical protein
VAKKKRGRKRKSYIDEITIISRERLRENVSDYSDIVGKLKLAPPTKRLMKCKINVNAEALFRLPLQQGSRNSNTFNNLFQNLLQV